MIRRRTVLRILAGTALCAVVLLAIGWLAFVPSASEPAYEFIDAWGEPGSQPGQFQDPIGIAVADEEVFVADSRNGRIQVFDLEGNFRRQFGEPGEAPGQLGRPMNLTIFDDELYVPEYFNDRIQVFSLDGTPKRIIGSAGDGPGEFSAPGGVAVAPNGDLFVAEFDNHRVQHLRADGRFVRQWGETGEPGRFGGRFIYPTDVVRAADGTLYVADGYAHRIRVIGPDGRLQNSWGGPFGIGIFAPFRGWFAVTSSVSMAPDGQLFVTDFYNHRVQKFAADGTFLTAFGEEGDGPGRFRHAMSSAAAADGTLYATDLANNRVQRWRPGNREDAGL